MIELKKLDHLRDVKNELNIYGIVGGDTEGIFSVKSCVDGDPLGVIASRGEGWDHVSVSRGDRTPTWSEMEQVKHMFFREDETAMQLHVPAEDHVSGEGRGRAIYCLHLWRSLDQEIPRPPRWMVG